MRFLLHLAGGTLNSYVMNTNYKSQLLISTLFLILSGSFIHAQENPFLGKWALHLPNGAGWLHVWDQDGYLDADILWKGGSVVPVSHVYYDYGDLFISRISPSTIERKGKRMHRVAHLLKLQVSGDKIVGTLQEPNRDGMGAKTTVFYGIRIPPLPAAPDLNNIKYGDPIILFNGKNLKGWKLVRKERKNGWSVKDGVLVNNPVQPDEDHHIRYGNLRTVALFEDFNLKLKVKIPKGSNSGIYLRGIYEVQVVDSYGADLDSHNMGALYSRITPSSAAEKEPGTWQDLDVTLCDRHLTVILNGTKIIDNKPIEGVTGGALTADQFAPGPIYLQGDHGAIMYKDIVLRPIEE